MAWFHQVQGVAFKITNDDPSTLSDNIKANAQFKALNVRVEENKFTLANNANQDEGYLAVFVGKTTLVDNNTYIGKTVIARLATDDEIAAAHAYGDELQTILASYGTVTRSEGIVLSQWD